MTKEALKLALEALVCLKKDFDADQFEWEIADEAITAIKAVLAQPEQEPVAWAMLHDNGHYIDAIHPDEHARVEGKYIHPLYTTPPQRTWVGLTDDEILKFRDIVPNTLGYDLIEFAQAIEAKLKEKNT